MNVVMKHIYVRLVCLLYKIQKSSMQVNVIKLVQPAPFKPVINALIVIAQLIAKAVSELPLTVPLASMGCISNIPSVALVERLVKILHIVSVISSISFALTIVETTSLWTMMLKHVICVP